MLLRWSKDVQFDLSTLRDGALRGIEPLIHGLSQTQGSHVCPDFLDIRQALLFGAGLSGVAPAEGKRTIREPNRVLLLVVHHDAVKPVVSVFVIHMYSS
jgi:hypothetical protein